MTRQRIIALIVIAFGGLVLLLAPEGSWLGLALVALGIAIELLGTLLARQRQR